ncbi:TolC family protein [Thiomonas sp.]|uniref:TolC family protein n=1 Tax=Thiomonas sp. TaxID=2047785 RepID=UPI0026295024|nr:TolC family protein [Thiomonas sp.]
MKTRAEQVVALPVLLPTVKLAWQYSHSTQPVIEGLGLPAFGAATRDNNVALEVQIPLFDGWAQRDREQEASAQAQQQLATLDLTRQKVIQQVWSADQSYSEAADDVRMRQRVAKLATQALRAARKRYRHGVASVLEVLNAQAALVRARAQQVDASRRWLLARLNLAYAVGDLGTSPGLFGARALDAPQLGAR